MASSDDSPYYYGGGGKKPVLDFPSAPGSASSPYYYASGGVKPIAPTPSNTNPGAPPNTGGAGTLPPGTDPADNPLYTPRSLDELQKLAASQIDAEISGQVDPLTSQIGTLGQRETSAIQQIGSLFGTLQP